MTGWMWWLGIANAADLDLSLSVGESSVAVVLADLQDGEARRIELGEVSAAIELAGQDLRVTVEDLRGKVIAAPTLEVGSGARARLSTPTPLGLLQLSARLRDEILAGDDVRCEALRNPTAAALEAALGRVRAAGGAPQVFAGSATVVQGSSSTSGDAMWVCAWPTPAR